MAFRSETRRPNWLVLWYLLGGLLLLFYLVPLGALFVAQSPVRVVGRFASPAVAAAVANSLLTASVSALLSTACGVPLAYWLARTRTRGRTLVGGLVALPLVLPPVVSGMVLLLVVGPHTVVGQVGSTLGLPLTRSLAGIVLAQTFVSSPFVVVTAKVAFDDIDPRFEDASRSLGAGAWSTFRRVSLPLAWPGILAGTTLAFARALGEFGATLMLAYYPRTMPVQIWVSFTTLGLESAFPVAIVLLLVAVGALAILAAIGRAPW